MQNIAGCCQQTTENKCFALLLQVNFPANCFALLLQVNFPSNCGIKSRLSSYFFSNSPSSFSIKNKILFLFQVSIYSCCHAPTWAYVKRPRPLKWQHPASQRSQFGSSPLWSCHSFCHLSFVKSVYQHL